MPHFTKQIGTPEGNFTFYFNRIYTVEGTRYHVSVIDKDRRSLSFNMEDKKGIWKLANSKNCPDWINKLEPELSKVIIEHLAESS